MYRTCKIPAKKFSTSVYLVNSLCQWSVPSQKGAVGLQTHSQEPRWDNRKVSGTTQRAARFVFRGFFQKSNPSWAVEQFRGRIWLFAMAQLSIPLLWAASLTFQVTYLSVLHRSHPVFSENTIYLLFISPAHIFLTSSHTSPSLLPFPFFGPQLRKSLLLKQSTSAYFLQLYISIVWSWIILWNMVP